MAKARRRRQFDDATKRKAVAAIGRDGTLTEISKRLRIQPSLLARWRRALDGARSTRARPARRQRTDASLVSQIDRLVVELESLRAEVQVLETTRTRLSELVRHARL